MGALNSLHFSLDTGTRMAEDYYKTLGVAREASQEDIQKAYRGLARKYHPDLNPDDANAKKKFQEVQAAFDVLNDSSKRELYDRYGSSFENIGAGGPSPGQRGGNPFQGGGEEFDFSQLFGERFGGGGMGGFADMFRQAQQPRGAGRRARAATPTRGADVRFELEIPFNTAITGGEAHVSMPSPTGEIEQVTVKIPAGIEEGKKLRLRGHGEPAQDGGEAGDALITIHIAAHPWFQRKGDSLQVKVPVTLREAAEGAKVDVPTPKGIVALKIPKGCSSGTRLRIKGQGVSVAGKPAGDLFADIQVILPSNLDEESLELIQKFDARNPLDPRKELRW
jgi:curved DNA-binding protein